MNKLKKVRLEKGLTQKQLSDMADINMRVLQHYEQGSKNFDHARLDTILKICVALDCKMADIIEASEYVELLNQYE